MTEAELISIGRARRRAANAINVNKAGFQAQDIDRGPGGIHGHSDGVNRGRPGQLGAAEQGHIVPRRIENDDLFVRFIAGINIAGGRVDAVAVQFGERNAGIIGPDGRDGREARGGPFLQAGAPIGHPQVVVHILDPVRHIKGGRRPNGRVSAQQVGLGWRRGRNGKLAQVFGTGGKEGEAQKARGKNEEGSGSFHISSNANIQI